MRVSIAMSMTWITSFPLGRKATVDAVTQSPSYDFAPTREVTRKEIEQDSEIQSALLGPAIGNITHFRFVGLIHDKIAIQDVLSSPCARWDR